MLSIALTVASSGTLSVFLTSAQCWPADPSCLQCITVVDTITYFSMLCNRFHFYRNSVSRFFTLFPFRPLAFTSTGKSPAKYLTYWYRPHLSETKLPILFIHGIGVGLYPYTNFLRDINRGGASDGDDTRVGVVAVEI